MMKKLLIAVCALALPSFAVSQDAGTVIFEDNFERNEADDAKEDIGQGWNTNSKKRAGGNKQADLKNGALYIYRHKTADHGVSVTHPAEFQDGIVELKFMLENEKDSLKLNFADLQYKKVWAGHLFAAIINPQFILIQDLKTGTMNLEMRELKKTKKLTREMKKQLAKKTKRFPHKLENGKWHTVQAKVVGDTLSVSINGAPIASFQSEGIAHPTKRMLRLGVAKNAVVDDVKITKLK